MWIERSAKAGEPGHIDATADKRMRGGPLPLVTLDDAAARMSPRISR